MRRRRNYGAFWRAGTWGVPTNPALHRTAARDASPDRCNRRRPGGSLMAAIGEVMRPGTVDEIQPDSGEWILVDIGFSRDGATSGILEGDAKPRAVSFVFFQSNVVQATSTARGPLNLLIEAPLSVAFTKRGNLRSRLSQC